MISISRFVHRTRLLGVLALLVLLTACVLKQPGRVQRLSRQDYNPRPADYPIAVTEGEYDVPYIEIAIVTTKPYDDRVMSAATEELRRKARELGGDGVVRVTRNGEVGEEFTYSPGNLSRVGTRFVTQYTLTGVVVRFVRESSAMEEPVMQPPTFEGDPLLEELP